MRTISEVVFLIQKTYPELKHGVDYHVAFKVDPDRPTVQIEDARIDVWRPTDVTQPTEGLLASLWSLHAQEYADRVQATGLQFWPTLTEKS
jgi:hypothetical protein